MMNNSGPRYKRSSLEVITNRYIICCIITLIAMCLFDGICSIIWLRSMAYFSSAPFMMVHVYPPLIQGAVNVISSMLNYQILVPLSLYISVELIKLGQAFFISQDMDLYSEEKDRATECRSLNIPEELGQIQYILSDKTGTLTENQMIFRKCSVNGISYGDDMDIKSLKNSCKTEDVVISPSLKQYVVSHWDSDVILSDFFIALTVCNTVVVNNAPRVDSIDEGYAEDGCFISGNSMFYITKEDFEREEKRASEEKSRKQWTQEAIAIKGGEKGCSEAASKYDVKVPEVLLSVSSSSYATQITVQIEDDIERSTVRKISSRNSFGIRTSKLQSRLSSLNNSVSSFGKRFFNGAHRRKMKFQMMRQPEKTMYEAESPDELALVYGAKAYGFFLLRRSVDDITVLDPYSNQRIFKIYNVFPFDSHRKRMSIIVRDEIGIVLYCKGADNEIFNALSPSFCHSAEGGRIIKLSRQHLEEFSSQGLRTLCVAMKRLTPFSYEVWNARHTAIEKDENMKGKDERLRRSIAQMENDLSLIGVTAIEDRLQDGVAETLSDLRRAGIQVWLLTGDKRETALNIARSCNLFPPECTVVNVSDESDVDAIKDLDDDEICLTLCEKGVELLKKPESSLVEAMKRIRSVLCYRMSPATKADVVRVVKKSLKGKVLAIGDGANDVSMIQCADVGIGISGQEGLQAVMASDFAIARFRFLRKLLLVHGHWCYDRLARVLLYFFYKNAAFVFVAFWVQIYNGFSVAPALDELYMMSYSVIFTGVQPIVFGVFEQITNKECLLNDPFLYYVGREGQLYGRFYFWLNMLDALYQSVVIYFFTFLAFWDTNYSYHMFGFFLASSIFVCNNFHLAIETHHWTLGTVMVFMIFFVVHYVFFIIEDLVASPSWEFKDTPALVALRCMETYGYWSTLLFTTVIATFPRFFVHVVVNRIYPSSNRKEDGIQMYQIKIIFRFRLNISQVLEIFGCLYFNFLYNLRRLVQLFRNNCDYVHQRNI
ncbi:hypothetical protein AB6A40_001760 [Gnathostoma spinigerum]|uniref:Phospholipid-transporting ATPase n=1 Tax=Gnathostoma spinigerum TaxID=75299 RepID=A0ABD6E664_9BILA